MTAYAFHPDAFADLDEIWEYIAEDIIDAADRILADIHSTLSTLAESPQIGHRRPDLTTRPLRFLSCAMSTSSPTHLPRSRFGSWQCFTAAEIRDSWRPFFATGSNRDPRVGAGSRQVI